MTRVYLNIPGQFLAEAWLEEVPRKGDLLRHDGKLYDVREVIWDTGRRVTVSLSTERSR